MTPPRGAQPAANPAANPAVEPAPPSARRTVAILGTRGYPSYYGGFETAVRKIAPYLADHGWDVVVYGRHGASKLNDPARDRRIRTRLTKGLETKSLSTLTYGLTATIDAVRHKPDAALVMNVANGFWLPLLRLRGIPSLVNVDGIEWERAKWGRLAKFVFHTGAKMTARWGDRLVYDAHEIGRYWADQFGVDGAFIPYGGEDVAPEPVEPDLTRGGYALVVARFVPENTVPEFIEAARVIARDHDVVIVGSTGYEGELDQAVRELAAAEPRVTWLGHLSDDRKLHSLWQNAGAYFHGHSVGGTNPALVQAMWCGAPIVARDTVYSREVLAGAGILVQPTPSAIAEAVIALLDDVNEQARLSAAARARAESSYTWEGVCADYERELGQLVAKRSAARPG